MFLKEFVNESLNYFKNLQSRTFRPNQPAAEQNWAEFYLNDENNPLYVYLNDENALLYENSLFFPNISFLP